MKKVVARKLTLDDFNVYGSFARLIDPRGPKLGEEPIEFYRDMLQLDLGESRQASFSICRVLKRPPVIGVAEYHNSCGEGILPLDGDVYIHVGPATPPGRIPFNDFEVFHVPAGTMVVLRPGVWHHAPFAARKEAVNVLIVLPERIYANDCQVHRIPRAKQLTIDSNGAAH